MIGVALFSFRQTVKQIGGKIKMLEYWEKNSTEDIVWSAFLILS